MAWWWRGLVCLVPVLAVAIAAFAARAENVWSDPKIWSEPNTWSDDFPPMRFAVVRSNTNGCEPSCPEWISAEGAIEAGTPAKLKRILKTLGRRHLPIIVNSPGGNVDAALQLGRIIRKNKLDIAVGTTSFSDCLPGVTDCPADDGKGTAHLGVASDSGAICNSACPLMFAGGVRRWVGEKAFLGVHQITTTYFRTRRQYRTTYQIVRGKKYRVTTETITQDDAGRYKTYKMSKSLEKKLAAYFNEMGVEEGVFVTMKNTPASAIHQLELQNMLRMKLVSSLDSLDVLTAANICRVNPMPENCRKIEAPADNPAADAVDAAGSSSDFEFPPGFICIELGSPLGKMSTVKPCHP